VLHHLDLSSNALGEGDLATLGNGVQHNQVLCGMHIEHNPGGGYLDANGFLRIEQAGDGVSSGGLRDLSSIQRCWCCGLWEEKRFCVRMPENILPPLADMNPEIESWMKLSEENRRIAADIQERMPFKAVHMRLTIDEEECRMQYDALEDIWFLHRMVPPNLGIACAVTVVPHTQDSAAHELQLQPCDTKTGSIIGQVLDVWMTAAASSEGSECDGSCPLPTAIPQHAQTEIVAKPRPMSSPGMRTASDLQTKLSPQRPMSSPGARTRIAPREAPRIARRPVSAGRVRFGNSSADEAVALSHPCKTSPSSKPFDPELLKIAVARPRRTIKDKKLPRAAIEWKPWNSLFSERQRSFLTFCKYTPSQTSSVTIAEDKVFDTDEILRVAFLVDWDHMKAHLQFSRINSDATVSEADGGSGVLDDIQESLWHHYRQILNCFRHFSGIAFISGPFSILPRGLSIMVREMEVDKACEGFSQGDVDRIFAAVDADVHGGNPRASTNQKKAIERWEFLEVLVRLALFAYFRPGGESTLRAAVSRFVGDHLAILEQKGFSVDPDTWRREHLYTVTSERILSHHWTALSSVFKQLMERFSTTSERKAFAHAADRRVKELARVHSRDRTTSKETTSVRPLNPNDLKVAQEAANTLTWRGWSETLKRVLPTGLSTTRGSVDARLRAYAFVASKLTYPDETDGTDTHKRLTLHDFVEALWRLSMSMQGNTPEKALRDMLIAAQRFCDFELPPPSTDSVSDVGRLVQTKMAVVRALAEQVENRPPQEPMTARTSTRTAVRNRGERAAKAVRVGVKLSHNAKDRRTSSPPRSRLPRAPSKI
jgi:hypothetical protein